LTGGDQLDGLTLCDYIRRYLMHLLRVDGGGDGFRRYVLWCSLHSACQLLRTRHKRLSSVFGNGGCLGPSKLLDPASDHLPGSRRPAKFWGICCDYLLGCLAVRLPSQEGSDTNKHGEQVAGKASRASPSRLLFYCEELTMNRL
jgi:hypothetical protein